MSTPPGLGGRGRDWDDRAHDRAPLLEPARWRRRGGPRVGKHRRPEWRKQLIDGVSKAERKGEYEARWLLKVDDVKNDGMRYVLLTRRRE